MARLDQNGGGEGPRTVQQMGPSANEIQGTMQALDTSAVDPVEEGPITTAASYTKRVKARRRATASLKGKGQPLGGAPPLDSDKTAAIAAHLAPQPVFETEDAAPEADPQEYRVPEEPPPALGGVGSGFEINQQMARGELERPVSMKEAKAMGQEGKNKKLSAETVADLEKAQAQVEETTAKEPEGEQDTTTAELEAAEKEMLKRDTPFNYDNIMAQQKSLMSPERQKIIESRLEELDLADMIVRREIVQHIPVVAGKLSYTLRTFNQHEHLFCLQYVYENPGSVTYAEEFLNTCKLVCALVAVNGALLPDHRKGAGTPNEEVDMDSFKKKMFHVASFPVQIIADLSVQAIWFNQRVNELLGVENLKNG